MSKLDLNHLEVGSVLWWERPQMYWAVEGVTPPAVASVRRILECGIPANWVFKDLPARDDLFAEAILYACPRHAYRVLLNHKAGTK